MLLRAGVFFAVIATASVVRADCGTSPDQPAEVNVSGQILVRFEKGVDETDAARIIARIGAREVGRLLDGEIYLIQLPYPAAQSDIIAALSATDGVVYAEPNQRVSIPAPPEDNGSKDGDSELIPLPGID